MEKKKAGRRRRQAGRRRRRRPHVSRSRHLVPNAPKQDAGEQLCKTAEVETTGVRPRFRHHRGGSAPFRHKGSPIVIHRRRRRRGLLPNATKNNNPSVALNPNPGPFCFACPLPGSRRFISAHPPEAHLNVRESSPASVAVPVRAARRTPPETHRARRTVVQVEEKVRRKTIRAHTYPTQRHSGAVNNG